MAEIPAKTVEAEHLSADLKRRGFRFVGPTIMYAHMQATGMVNDHTVDCFRWPELKGGGAPRRATPADAAPASTRTSEGGLP
jgi:DNA-3-methyladenine glycosylase I